MTQPTLSIQSHLGRPMIFLNGKPLPLTMYSPPGGSPSFLPFWDNAMGRFLDQQLNLYLVNIPRTRSGDDIPATENFWQGDTITATPMVQPTDEIDHSPLLVRERCPDAHMMIRFSARPAPDWMDAHPDELSVNEAGERMPIVSLASQRGWAMMARYCAAMIEYAESRPWADRVIGYCNYHYSEGTHPLMTTRHCLFDHSPAMQQRWRTFLQTKYKDVAALRDAHRDDSLTFETIAVPRDALDGPRRQVAATPYWQSAADNQPLRDYLELVRQLYHENFRALADASRHAAGPNKLLMYDMFKIPLQGWALPAFFGVDGSENTHWPMQYAEMLAGSGNVRITELLDHPGFDGLVTPYDYQVRSAGGVFEPEGAADSMVLRNKLFFVEWDIRTFCPPDRTVYGSVKDMAEYEAVTWRDLASSLTRGFNNYFCDHDRDYHAKPEMHDIITRQAKVIEQSVNWPHETVPGIAMVLDQEAIAETSGTGHVLNEAVMWEQKIGISRCGVPYRIYLLEDLELDNFPEHRVFYFPNLYRIDDPRLELIRRVACRNGNVVVFGPGSGISDGQTVSTESATRLTGFDFRLRPANYSRRFQITNYDHTITRDMPADAILGSPVAYGPQLYPTTGTRLAHAWTQQGDDDTGLAVQSHGQGARSEAANPDALGQGDYAAVFSSTAPLTADLWRGLARFAGAHIYCDTNDGVLASKHLLALHAIKPGPRVLQLPSPHRVVDIIHDQLVSEHTDRITLNITPPATHFYHITPT